MESLTYESASKELSELLEDLKNEKIGIDELAEKMQRAAVLIAFCKNKLRETEESVQKILEQFET